MNEALEFFLTALAAAAGSVLSGMGVGGGGLMLLWFVFALKLPQQEAQAANLLLFAACALSSCFVHYKKRRLNFPLIALVSVLGCVGAAAGALILRRAAPDTPAKILGALLLCGGAVGLLKKYK